MLDYKGIQSVEAQGVKTFEYIGGSFPLTFSWVVQSKYNRGTIITGTAFAGYPNEFVFLDNIEDSSGNPIKDSSGKTIQGQTIYRKARNSVLLDSTGDVIEDGFEQQIEVVKFVWVSFISRLFLYLNPLGTVNAGQFVSNIESVQK